VAETLRVVFLAGDRREGEAARVLAEAGHRVATFATPRCGGRDLSVPDPLEALAEADAVVCPALGTAGDGQALYRMPPWSALPVEPAWLDAPPPTAPWLIGRPSPWLARVLAARGRRLFVYGERPEYAILNAGPTAEGAIAEASRLGGRAVWGARALVVGLGRTGQALVLRLLAWGAEVAAVARRPESRAWARLAGAEAAPMGELRRLARHAHFLLNTVPAPVVDRAVLAELPPGAVVVDIASHPGGTDFQAAETLGVPARLVPGIPGRDFPATAGRILAEVVEAMARGAADPAAAEGA
jgi:dipicolinate synthase subunit A